MSGTKQRLTRSDKIKQNDRQDRGSISSDYQDAAESVEGLIDESTWTCKDCGQSSSDENVQMVICECCSDKFCLPCINMNVDQYKSLQALAECENACWLCTNCLDDMKNKKKQSNKINNTKEIEALKTDMNAKMASLEEKIISLADALKTKPDLKKEEIEKSFADVLIGNKKTKANDEMNVKEIGVTGVMRNIVEQHHQQQQKELSEKEEREKNIILFKAKEETGKSAEERKASDSELTSKFLTAIGCDDYEVKGMFRLGKFVQADHDKGKIRPLKICFYNKDIKESVMRNLFKLKASNDPQIKNLQVGQDLSKSDRDAYRDKVEEAKAKSTDEVFWVVWGPPGALRLVKSTHKNQQGT